MIMYQTYILCLMNEYNVRNFFYLLIAFLMIIWLNEKECDLCEIESSNLTRKKKL